MVIVPHDREVYEFTPVQRPADKQDAEFITTHFDFNSMHDILIKLDILGHDVPTIIRILQDITGIDPLTIPLDDKETMELFSSLKPLGIEPGQLFDVKTGTLGIPEFGTRFVRRCYGYHALYDREIVA
jgi:DNA polymerase-3 subunit alpha (Gram-positive type)